MGIGHLCKQVHEWKAIFLKQSRAGFSRELVVDWLNIAAHSTDVLCTIKRMSTTPDVSIQPPNLRHNHQSQQQQLNGMVEPDGLKHSPETPVAQQSD